MIVVQMNVAILDRTCVWWGIQVYSEILAQSKNPIITKVIANATRKGCWLVDLAWKNKRELDEQIKRGKTSSLALLWS